MGGQKRPGRQSQDGTTRKKQDLREPARPTRALCLAYIGTGEEAGSTTANGGETKNAVTYKAEPDEEI
jgi:hypothetical protein